MITEDIKNLTIDEKEGRVMFCDDNEVMAKDEIEEKIIIVRKFNEIISAIRSMNVLLTAMNRRIDKSDKK